MSWTARGVAALLLLGPCAAAAERPVQFSRDVLPLLSEHCFQCHGPDEKARKADLRLDRREGAFREEDGIAIIVPGKSAASELFRRIATTDEDDIMPPPKLKRGLSAEQIHLIQRWIDEGAAWGEHWAFEKLLPPPLPAVVDHAQRAANPIDQFVLARLQKEGLAPAPPASPERWIRRVTLLLTGLPPAPGDVDAFLQDNSPEAHETVVNRLLNSTAYGERMAWPWLDAARYADSNGYQGDAERTMWPWRDWVIEAFNQNLSFDQFTIWQLAGDLLPESSLEQKLATGFSRNHMINGEGGRIAEENRVEYVMDMAETMGTVWLGLTMNCCRCHDHKYDPLSNQDYYRLFAFFNQTPVTGAGGDPQTKPSLELPTPRQKADLAQAESQIQEAARTLDEFEIRHFARPEGASPDQSERAAPLAQHLKEILKLSASKRSRGQLAELEKEFEKNAPEYFEPVKALREAIDSRDRLNRSIVRVMVMEDRPTPRQTFVLDKGIYDKPLEEVRADVPEHLPGLPPEAPRNRLGLAEWTISPENPLTARVTVNRIWQEFFGAGLVKTAEDFGVQGEFPSHPELLDWLAWEFMRSGWDLKHICRLIATSSTFRQTSKVTAELLERDPENRLLARGPRFRMPSWMIRDQALAASGLLVSEIGGPPVKPYQPAGVWEEATFGNKTYQQDNGSKLYRRSIYTFWRRIVGPSLFFDSASRQTCTVKSPRTNSPLHALATLNDVTYVEAARGMAERVLGSADGVADSHMAEAFRLVLARKPSQDEMKVLRSMLAQLLRDFAQDPEAARSFLSVGESKPKEGLPPVHYAAFSAFCSALLNLDEAVTIE